MTLPWRTRCHTLFTKVKSAHSAAQPSDRALATAPPGDDRPTRAFFADTTAPVSTHVARSSVTAEAPMRKVMLFAVVLVGCAKSEKPATDTTAVAAPAPATPAAPAKLT